MKKNLPTIRTAAGLRLSHNKLFPRCLMAVGRKERDMGHVIFRIPGKPQGKARARTGYNPKAGRVTSRTPDNTVLYENLIKTCYMQATDLVFPEGTALAVRIDAYFEPAKSVSKKRREQMLSGAEYPTKKPDIDNIVKVVLDALNGLAYKDDTQVVRVLAQKSYYYQSYVEVQIKTLEK